MSENILDSKTVIALSYQADEILDHVDDSNNHEVLLKFLNSVKAEDYSFESLIDEAQYYFMLGNCAQVLYSYHRLDWFSDELSNSVIFFRKALYALGQIKFPDANELDLQSRIQTNLGNCLSSQGRAFCAIPLYDQAIKWKKNPVPILTKISNELFIASNLYDPSHKNYHSFVAYQLIQLGLEQLDQFEPGHKVAFSEGSDFINFKTEFESKFRLEDFDGFETYKEKYKSKEQRNYLKWCGDNRLFINDLNDVNVSEIVYQDIMTLPSIFRVINPTLSMYEELMYHGNFDELKNDYCYARYLTFLAQNMSDDRKHFFNQTYSHVEDMALTITNIKASHLKSAFKMLYSIFDKIAFFIHRYFDLNDIKNDTKITFDSIFREIKNKKEWLPNSKLKDSQNYFLHALFYILKDIRDVKDAKHVSRWLDPDAKAFSDIRNAIEHRSLKIIEDFGYTLTQSDKGYKEAALGKVNDEIAELKKEYEKLSVDLVLAKNEKNENLFAELEIKKKFIDELLREKHSIVYEKEKLSSHSVLIEVSEFESRLMTLMKLARNSIMYLSLAIHVNERNRPEVDSLTMDRKVPLKK